MLPPNAFEGVGHFGCAMFIVALVVLAYFIGRLSK
jgi:hypothetical protein